MTDQKAILSVSRCTSYSDESVSQAVLNVLEPLGGMKAFVKAGQKVFIKPNMLSCKEPQHAATTHPAIIEAVVKECQSIGAQVFIGDSPPMALGRIEAYWANTGFKGVAQRTGATLLALEKEPTRLLSISSPGGPLDIHVTEWLFKADVVINLPKLKTHNLTTITGAIKNHFGLMPGLQKAQMHKRFPQLNEFGSLMADICAATPIPLTIFDGIEGMDGQGPAGGRVIPTGLIMASKDPMAIDLAFCEIAGLDSKKIPTLIRWREMKYGINDISEVQHFGEPLSTFVFKKFQAPAEPIFTKFPKVFLKIAQKLIWMRPNLKPKLCVRCKACAKICPAVAISIRDEGPYFNRHACISCFCCMEVCPVDAIEMKTSDLIKLGIVARAVKRFIFRQPPEKLAQDVEDTLASTLK